VCRYGLCEGSRGRRPCALERASSGRFCHAGVLCLGVLLCWLGAVEARAGGRLRQSATAVNPRRLFLPCSQWDMVCLWACVYVCMYVRMYLCLFVCVRACALGCVGACAAVGWSHAERRVLARTTLIWAGSLGYAPGLRCGNTSISACDTHTIHRAQACTHTARAHTKTRTHTRTHTPRNCTRMMGIVRNPHTGHRLTTKLRRHHHRGAPRTSLQTASTPQTCTRTHTTQRTRTHTHK